MVHVVRTEPLGSGLRVAIAVARFNEEVTERLLHGALQACRERGVADGDITVVHVPGAFELPLACRWLTATADAVVALGAVIRGDTDHYDYVCAAASDGVLHSSLDTGVPIAFGVLTCDTLDQALQRAGGNAGNKGADAVLAALEMAGVATQLRVATRAGGAKTPPPR